MSYLNKTADELLLARVVEVNGDKFAPGDLTFGNPIATTEFGKNTKFPITPGPRFTPEPDVEYFIWVDRLDATELFRRYNVDVLEVPNVGGTVEVAAWIAQTYGLPIVASDVVAEEIGEDEFVLVFSDTSKIIFGQLQCKRSEDPLYLSDLLTVTVLNGFDYPDAVVDHLVPPVVVQSGEMGPHATTPIGNLLVGTNVPAKGMVIATNNELELAISASRAFMAQDPNYIIPDGSVYTVELSQNQEWNFPFSVALFNSDESVTDLYEIVLYVLSVATGERLQFVLTKDAEGGYHWINDEFSLDISDSVVSDDVIQNIQRLSFYADQFPLTPRKAGTPSALLGEFEIGLVGYRINSLVPRVAAIAKVVAVDSDVLE